jgi:hypothetical protein
VGGALRLLGGEVEVKLVERQPLDELALGLGFEAGDVVGHE